MKESAVQIWISRAALTSAILAVLAALSSLNSGSHGNAVTRELIRNTNQWSYFQAKGIKASLLQTKMDLLDSMGKTTHDQDQTKLSEYKAEQDQIADKAREQEILIEYHVKLGGLYSRSVTLFQIAIGIVGVSILTRKKSLWMVGLGIASIGVVFVIQALLNQ